MNFMVVCLSVGGKQKKTLKKSKRKTCEIIEHNTVWAKKYKIKEVNFVIVSL